MCIRDRGSTNTYAGVISSSGTNIRGAADAANKSNEFAYLKIKSCYIGIGLWGVPGNEEANMIDTCTIAVSYTHLRAHETVLDLVCRLLLEKKNKQTDN